MEKTENQSLGKTILCGTLVALSTSMALVLVFAFCLKFFGMSDGVITVIVEIIKCTSILFGTFWVMKKKHEMGFLTGMLIGLMFVVLSFFVFSCLDGFSFVFDISLINNMLFGSLCGGIAGIIGVNIFSKK